MNNQNTDPAANMLSSTLGDFLDGNIYIVFFSILLAIYIGKWLFMTKNLPPGPYNLPIVGYVPFLDIKLELGYKKLSEKYGDVFGFKLAQRYVIVLCSWDAVKEAFIEKGDTFSERPKPFSVSGWLFDYEGIMASSGEIFKEQKRFILSSLRQLGYGKDGIKDAIQEEAEAAVNLFRDYEGPIDDISSNFNTMTTNIICSITFGKRFNYGDQKLKNILDIFQLLTAIVQEVIVFEAFPILRCLPSFFGWKKMEKIKHSLDSFVDEIIEDHIESFDPNSLRDLIDYYLKAMQEKGLKFKDDNNGTIFSRSFLRNNLSVLFLAGTDTSSSVLTFAIKMLIIHPEIQQKVQEEIDRVIGRSRLPAWSDRTDLIYTSATILEVHRYCSIVPVSPVHTNSEEAALKGFTIPKETYILANLWQIHHDESLWKNPEKFDPTRFINEKGEIEKPEYLIPFSAGRRFCLGEALASMEILIFLTSLLQNFTFLPVDNNSKEYEIIHGFVRKLKPFNVKIVTR